MQTSTFAIILRGSNADPTAVKGLARVWHAQLEALGCTVEYSKVEAAEHLDLCAEVAAAKAEAEAVAAKAKADADAAPQG